MDNKLLSSYSLEQQQPPQQQQQKNYEINRTMLTTTDEGFYFSFIDDKDIVYTALCESEFPLKQAQILLNRIKRELKNMPDYFRQSVNSIQTFARTFIVPIIQQMDAEVGRMAGLRQKQEGIQVKQEQEQKMQQQRQQDEQKDKKQQTLQQKKVLQQCEEEPNIIQFQENEDDDDEAEEQKHTVRELTQEKQAHNPIIGSNLNHLQVKNNKSSNQEPSKIITNINNNNSIHDTLDNDTNQNKNGLNRNRRMKTLHLFKKGIQNQYSENQISIANEESNIDHQQIQSAQHFPQQNQDEQLFKHSFNNNHLHLHEEIPKETFVSSPSENPITFISNSSVNPGIFASTNGSYDPHKQLLDSNNKNDQKQEHTRVQQNIVITAFEGSQSKFNTSSTDVNNKQRIQEISIAPLDSSNENNNNNNQNLPKIQEKYAIFSSCREINCSLKEIDYQSQGYTQKKLSQTYSMSHPKNQEYYLDDIQIQIDKSHKFYTESSAHPSNFSTADQKQTADMGVLKELKLKDCGAYDEEQNIEDAKQHNKEEIEKMQQKQMKNAANLRSIKIKVIACILVISVVLSIALPLIK